MSTFYFLFQILAWTLGVFSAVSSLLLFTKLRWPAAVGFIFKIYLSALAPVLVIIGVLITIVGLISENAILTIIGFYDIVIYLGHLLAITREPPGWATFLKELKGTPVPTTYHLEDRYFISSRKDLSLPGTPKAEVQKNISYSGLPVTKRKLWCDIWEPPEQIRPSGLALIYLHGSAWYLFDKDLGTRPFFNHLAAQGHVIMDVAYRLAPEADMMDMIQDVKRAIGWLKDNALRLRIDPEKIVLSGGSAGGHLALMAAYTAGDLAFSPPELVNEDLHVQGVISLYGPSDLKEIYYHTRQDLTTRNRQGRPEKKAPKSMPKWVRRTMGKDYHRLGFNKGLENAGALAPILGGHPDEKPETYRFFSPIEHVSPDCPPTLIIHGQHDLLAPVSSSQRLYQVLQENEVISYLHLFPQTDHAFDLILPGISCSSHNAIYDIERFLAILSENTSIKYEPETSDETQALSDVNDLIFI